jgi:hypothetical protein
MKIVASRTRGMMVTIMTMIRVVLRMQVMALEAAARLLPVIFLGYEQSTCKEVIKCAKR